MTAAIVPQEFADETAPEEVIIDATPVRAEKKPEVTFDLLAVFAAEAEDTPRMSGFKQAGVKILKRLGTATPKDLTHLCTVQMMPQSKAAPNDVAFRIVGFKQSLISSEGLPASPFHYLVSFSTKGRVEVARVFCDEAKNKGFRDESLYTATARKSSFGTIGWGEADASKIDTAKIGDILIQNMRADGVLTPRAHQPRTGIAVLAFR